MAYKEAEVLEEFTQQHAFVWHQAKEKITG